MKSDMIKTAEMNADIFDGFTVNMFFDEDGDYLAHLVELPNVSAFGPTPAEALEELKTAWELMKECYQMDGEPIPKPPSGNGYEGPFNLPVDAQLYHALANEAAKAGISLYTLVTQRLKSTEPVVKKDKKNESIYNLPTVRIIVGDYASSIVCTTEPNLAKTKPRS